MLPGSKCALQAFRRIAIHDFVGYKFPGKLHFRQDGQHGLRNASCSTLRHF